ncbi:MAG: preprotein translocase subunit SecG [Granulosicoccus sp.]
MQSIALVIHVVLAVAVIGLVLMQHGKGADAGAAFGSGASATVFGARGSASFLTRATTILAAAFFATSLFLFYLAAHRDSSIRSVTDIPGIVEEVAPVEAPSDLPGGVDADGEASGESGASDSDMPVPAQ